MIVPLRSAGLAEPGTPHWIENPSMGGLFAISAGTTLGRIAACLTQIRASDSPLSTSAAHPSNARHLAFLPMEDSFKCANFSKLTLSALWFARGSFQPRARAACRSWRVSKLSASSLSFCLLGSVEGQKPEVEAIATYVAEIPASILRQCPGR